MTFKKTQHYFEGLLPLFPFIGQLDFNIYSDDVIINNDLFLAIIVCISFKLLSLGLVLIDVREMEKWYHPMTHYTTLIF